MSMRINIENILKSHKSVFEDILAKLQEQSLYNTKRDLKLHTHHFDQVLFDAINLTLKKLHQEENFISRLLYYSFGIGREKNKRREQLIILGSELKLQLTKERKFHQKLIQNQENLNASLKNLKLLRKAFKNKITFITSILLQERCYNYMQEIDDKVEEILQLQKELTLEKSITEKNLKIYEKQLKKIPRYHELQEEGYIGLLANGSYAY